MLTLLDRSDAGSANREAWNTHSIWAADVLYFEALEQLSAQQGKLPPKLPSQGGGRFDGLIGKLVGLISQASPL